VNTVCYCFLQEDIEGGVTMRHDLARLVKS